MKYVNKGGLQRDWDGEVKKNKNVTSTKCTGEQSAATELLYMLEADSLLK